MQTENVVTEYKSLQKIKMHRLNTVQFIFWQKKMIEK